MNTTHQALIKQITDEAQSLPENLMREVLDFIGYLRTKYEQNGEEETRQQALLATFGSWEDDREPEEIVQDIHTTRTIIEESSQEFSEQSDIDFLMSIVGMFDSGTNKTSENVEAIVSNLILKKHGKTENGSAD